MGGVEGFDLSGVETKQDVLEVIEDFVDREMDDHGLSDDDNDVEYGIVEKLFEFLDERGLVTNCDTCGQWYVRRLNPEGCPYTEREEHENDDEEDDDE